MLFMRESKEAWGLGCVRWRAHPEAVEASRNADGASYIGTEASRGALDSN